MMKQLSRFFLPFQILALSVSLLSCEAPESHKKRDASEKRNPDIIQRDMTPFIYRGMFSASGDRKLYDCSSGKQYLVSDKSDLSSINNAISRLQNPDTNKRFYIEAEGFISTEENPSVKQNDTVLVIGRVSRIDMQFDCNPK